MSILTNLIKKLEDAKLNLKNTSEELAKLETLKTKYEDQTMAIPNDLEKLFYTKPYCDIELTFKDLMEAYSKFYSENGKTLKFNFAFNFYSKKSDYKKFNKSSVNDKVNRVSELINNSDVNNFKVSVCNETSSGLFDLQLTKEQMIQFINFKCFNICNLYDGVHCQFYLYAKDTTSKEYNNLINNLIFKINDISFFYDNSDIEALAKYLIEKEKTITK